MTEALASELSGNAGESNPRECSSGQSPQPTADDERRAAAITQRLLSHSPSVPDESQAVTAQPKRKGGRAKGQKNHFSMASLGPNASPLETLLALMRYSRDPRRKLEAAKAAAPYMHARLLTQTINANVTHRSIKTYSDAELLAIGGTVIDGESLPVEHDAGTIEAESVLVSSDND